MNRLEALVDDQAPRLAVRLRVLKKRLERDLVLELVDRVVAPGDAVVDVGANRGVYTRALVRRVGARGTVWAVEPYPANARALRAAFPPGSSNVVVCEVAASDLPGAAVLHVPVTADHAVHAMATLNAVSTAHDEVPVALRPLDELVADAVTFVKVDVEGHELSVLLGATALIARSHPTIVMEIEERHCPGAVAAVGAFLARRGYAGFYLGEHGLHPFATFDLQRHQLNFHGKADSSGKMPRGYVNNFVFVAPHARDRISDLVAKVVALD